MARKPSVLLAVFERLSDPVVQSQVLEHARIMQRMGVAEFEIWVAAWGDDMYAQSQSLAADAAAKAEAPVHVWHAIAPRWPMSTHLNGRRLLAQVARDSKKKFTHLHARSDYAAGASRIAAQHLDIPLIWDCRGDAKAEIMSRVGLSLSSRWLREKVIERRMRRAAQHSNRAIFVSEPLRQRMAPHWGEKTSLIIPCGAASDLFFFDQGLREKTRRDLGFSDDTTVFVYSGSLVEYQKFPETVAMYRRLAATTRNTRLLVLTKDRKKAAALTGEDPAILIRSAGHSEINGYLNAADVAFMLRDPTAINIVASPTKFAEYGLTGLPVIMSRSVPDSYEFAKQTGSLIDVTDIDAPRSLAIVDRAAVADQFRRRLTKQAQSESYKTLYS